MFVGNAKSDGCCVGFEAISLLDLLKHFEEFAVKRRFHQDFLGHFVPMYRLAIQLYKILCCQECNQCSKWKEEDAHAKVIKVT